MLLLYSVRAGFVIILLLWIISFPVSFFFFIGLIEYLRSFIIKITSLFHSNDGLEHHLDFSLWLVVCNGRY